MNNAINEIKITLEGTMSRITETEERISEVEDEKKGHEKLLKEIIAEKFHKMGKEIVTQVQETQRVQNRINPRQTPQDTY